MEYDVSLQPAYLSMGYPVYQIPAEHGIYHRKLISLYWNTTYTGLQYTGIPRYGPVMKCSISLKTLPGRRDPINTNFSFYIFSTSFFLRIKERIINVISLRCSNIQILQNIFIVFEQTFSIQNIS